MEEDLRFWIGWEEPGSDSRPMNFPPDERVQNYWESGMGATNGNEYRTMCAVVDARDERHAQVIVRRDWRTLDFRFCIPKGSASDGWTPEPTRFAWHNGGLGKKGE